MNSYMVEMKILRPFVEFCNYVAKGYLVGTAGMTSGCVLGGLLFIVSAGFAPELRGSVGDPSEKGLIVIEYRGQKFQLPENNTAYSDAQAREIETLLLGVQPPAVFEEFSDLIDFAVGIFVPGYGRATGGFGDETELGVFTFVSAQVPQKDLHRVFVFRQDDGGESYHLFHEFMYEGFYPPSIIFKAKGHELLYTTDMLGHNGGRSLIGKKRVEKVSDIVSPIDSDG